MVIHISGGTLEKQENVVGGAKIGYHSETITVCVLMNFLPVVLMCAYL